MKKAFLLTMWLAQAVWGDSLLDAQTADLYALRPLHPGELVTVVITDKVTTNQAVNVQNKKDHTVTLPVGSGLLAKMFLGGDVASGSDNTNKQTASTQQEFSYTVTAKVVSVEPGNVVVLEAHNSIELDGKCRELEMRGRVRRQDIGLDNKVASDHIADAVVTVDGAQAPPGGGTWGIFDVLLSPLH